MKKKLYKFKILLLNGIWNVLSQIYLKYLGFFGKLPMPQSGNAKSQCRPIYLTFDDGHSKSTEKILDILSKYNAKATFFVVGNEWTDKIALTAAAGHTIGNHLMSCEACDGKVHDYKKMYASEEAFFQELNHMNDIIKMQTGEKTRFIRFPGGSSNTVSSFNPGIMKRLTRLVEESGYIYWDWNVACDSKWDEMTAYRTFGSIIKGIQSTSTGTVPIVLMHENKKGTIGALELIVVWGLKNGYTFLPLDELSPVYHHNISN